METLRFIFTTTFYPPYHLGGDAVHVKYLAEELAKKGHEVHVIHSLDAFRLKKKFFPEDIRHRNIQRHQLETPFGISSYETYFFGNSHFVNRNFKTLVDKVKPDIVHHHNISLLGYNILKKQREYVNIYTSHDSWLICQQHVLLKNGKEPCQSRSCFLCSIKCRKLPQLWRHRGAFNKAIRELDLLISPSNFIGDRISETMNLKLVTIPNFVPQPPQKIDQPNFSNYFLYAGALEKHKGIIELIKAFKEIKSDSRLLVAGTGSLRIQIEDFIKKNDLKNKIVLLGWVNYNFMCQLLKNANALLVPSICPENCPMVVLEAFSLGTPAIASDIGGLPEIIEKVDKNLLFKNSIELQNIISGFSKDKYPSIEIRNIYEKNFSPEIYLAKYFKAISTVRNN